MAGKKDISLDAVLDDLKRFYGKIEYLLSGEWSGSLVNDEELVMTDKIIDYSSEQIEKLYKFAVHGEGPDGEDIMQLLRPLVYVESYLLDLGTTSEEAKFSNLSYLYELSHARIHLDGDDENGAVFSPEDYLSVREVALLGSVDERSVRNAISKGEIQATREGKTTVISNGEARRWLLGRRGFKRTIWPWLDMESLDHINTISQFTDYLHTRKEEITSLQSIEELLSHNQHLTIDDVLTLEKGEFPWPISVCRELSGLYRVPEREFTQTILKLFFPEQYLLVS